MTFVLLLFLKTDDVVVVVVVVSVIVVVIYVDVGVVRKAVLIYNFSSLLLLYSAQKPKIYTGPARKKNPCCLGPPFHSWYKN